MWPKSYRDYETDKSLIKYQVEPGHGIIGCEMHELNGWGNTLHIPKGKFSGYVRPKVPFHHTDIHQDK
jgi:hypothetical protein